MAILAEDPDGNLKAKVLNPSKLFESSFVILSKPATQGDGEGDFDHMADVPVETNYETAKMRQDELIEQEKWQNGEYDELMLIENEGPAH